MGYQGVDTRGPMATDTSEYEELLRLLALGVEGIYLLEASLRLIVNHDYWLRRSDFAQFIVLGDPPGAASIDFVAATSALDHGQLQADSEQASILRIAASLATAYPVILREVVEGIEAPNIKHVAEAIMYADGFLESTAEPLA